MPTLLIAEHDNKTLKDATHKAVTAALDDPEAFTEEDVGATEGEDLPRAPVITVMGHIDGVAFFFQHPAQ